jgi:hypothetical protein
MAGFDLRKKTVHRKRGPFKKRATTTNKSLHLPRRPQELFELTKKGTSLHPP